MKPGIITVSLLLVILVSFFLYLFSLNNPVTYQEAKESYTTYSILKTGRDTNNELSLLFFKTDNNYISPIPVYLRLPTISLFGLTNPAVRIPNALIFLGLLTSFYFLSQYFFKNTTKGLISTAIFSLSPYLVQTALFDLEILSSLFFLSLGFNLYLRNKLKLSFLSLLFSAISSITAIPIILALTYKKSTKKITLAVTVLLLVLIFASFKFFPDYGNHLKRSSILNSLLPSSFSYIIERRLSIGMTHDSPLYTKEFNFNRLAFNKYFFELNQFTNALILPFNLERLTSPIQSAIILNNEWTSQNSLIKFFIWEIPLIPISAILFFKTLDKPFKSFVIGALISSIIFPQKGLSFFLLITPILYTLLIFYLKEIVWVKYTKPLIFSCTSIIIFFSLLSFYDQLLFHYPSWLNENDLRQYQIWQYVTDGDLKNGHVIVTDRLGEPVFYYAFYKKLDPTAFQNTKRGGVVDSGIKRVDSVGNVRFGSFKYYEAPRLKNELWIGLGGEFAGVSKDQSKINEVPDGQILKRITGVKQDNKFLGTELWFVRTKFDEK